MNEPDFLTSIPAWLKYLATGVGGMGATFLALRQWLSQAKVDRTANDANAATIERLQAQVVAERSRADELMREREAMVAEIGQLRGEVKALREQIETLRDIVTGQRGMQA